MILRAFSGLNNRKKQSKRTKINGKDEEKPKILSSCGLMTDWGLTIAPAKGAKGSLLFQALIAPLVFN